MDNLPVGVVRSMCAEVVIAVNIGTPLMRREQLSSVIGLTGQMINILTEQNVRAQIATLRPGDVLISPDLGALTAIDFNEGRQFIDRGEAAARAAGPQLAAFALSEPDYRAYLAARAKLADSPPPVIEFVRVEGTEYANPQALTRQLAVPLGEPLDTPRLDVGIARLYGTGEYERVDYHLVGDGKRDGLVVDVSEKKMGPNYLRFGLFYSTDFQGESTFALLMGHRRVWVNSLGAQWSNELELGRIVRAATEFYQPFDLDRNAFVAAYGEVQNIPRYVFLGSERIAEYSQQTNSAGLDFGVPFGNSGEIRAGPAYTFFKGTPTIAIPGFPIVRETDAGARVLARWDNLDNAFFPTRGARATLDVFYGQRVQRLGSGADEVSNRLARVDFKGLAAFPLTDKDSISVAVRAGAFNRDDPSFLNAFLLGGLLNLSGLRDGQLAGSYLGFGRAVYYHKLATVPFIGGAIYAGGSLEAGNVWQQRADVGANDLVKAGSVFFAADTFLGPFSFAYGRASGGASSFYLFLGRPQ